MRKYSNISLNNQWFIHQMLQNKTCIFCSGELRIDDRFDRDNIGIDCNDCKGCLTLYNDNLSFLLTIGKNNQYHLSYDYHSNELNGFNSLKGSVIFSLDSSQLLDLIDQKKLEIFDKLENLEFYS